jgi:hypothetical protein
LKIKHKRDESNVESVGAIAMTVVVVRLARSGRVVTDDEISALLKEETDAVKKRRDEMPAAEQKRTYEPDKGI